MFDNIVSNKYFIIALVIALVVVIYLYSQKKSCEIEGMKNLDLTPLSHELVEKPWTEDENDGKYKSVNNKFDKHADQYNKRKTNKNNNYLKRKDEIFQEYIEYDSYEDVIPENKKQRRKRVYPNNNNDIPKPLDNRPDLSQCQPCVCPGDDDYDDDDDEYIDYRPKKKHRNYKRKN
ncbi:hypothetical protein QJ856_gp0961 [Tupanvirus deep ocean]|uniref:Uncharacterized protein n=2 Tax=Tupanvirus TaxID=2094720 RepID=A0AC62A7N9_9VIRU|nr:hypothetical protein QJ856_gp0961 [Tupanvirus deep ocean]QKU33796.1 hypothetical protein [Tupanvirus deep ocean]